MIIRDFWLDSATNYERDRLNAFLDSLKKDDSVRYSLKYLNTRNYIVVIVEVYE